ncbi:MAG: aquaporin [Verrucomicrobia bacterium]|nr:aquaporin [Verrucomicrobiota bacterium]MBV9671220.1 aquaporin [Verrucomicrobiota bacterium]
MSTNGAPRDSSSEASCSHQPRPRFNRLEYLCELVGTCFNVFIGLSAVVIDFGHGSWVASIIHSASLRLLLNGLIFAGSGSLFAISPLGKLSGAHLNPCLSLAFWADRKMHLHDFFAYSVSQMIGAALAALGLVLLWKGAALSVNNGMTMPGPGFPIWFVFSAELLMTFSLVLMIFVFVSSHSLCHWTPLMTWILITFLVWVGAPVSGTSLNPARSFGPALVSWRFTSQWIYWIAPPTGALLAVLCFRFMATERRVLTAKLSHSQHYRSIFKNTHLPCRRYG